MLYETLYLSHLWLFQLNLEYITNMYLLSSVFHMPHIFFWSFSLFCFFLLPLWYSSLHLCRNLSFMCQKYSSFKASEFFSDLRSLSDTFFAHYLIPILKCLLFWNMFECRILIHVFFPEILSKMSTTTLCGSDFLSDNVRSTLWQNESSHELQFTESEKK